MASSTLYNQLAWGDQHTVCLNQLYTLYHPAIDWETQLCDLGYDGYPDPIYRDGESTYTPDFLSIGNNGDVQHIDVKGFENIRDHFSGDGDEVRSKIRESISDLTKYRDISNEMVSTYLEKVSEGRNIQSHEVVALIPFSIYEEFNGVIEDVSSNEGIIIWLIEFNGESKIWKAAGSHNSPTLNNELSSKLSAYPEGNDLVQFTRQTDNDIKRLKFADRLLTYCCREKSRQFHFDEIDEAMTSLQPPFLRHLPKTEREEFWQRFMYSMLHHFEVVEKAEDKDTYQWKKKRFIREPRDRHQIIADIKDHLGIGQ